MVATSLRVLLFLSISLFSIAILFAQEEQDPLIKAYNLMTAEKYQDALAICEPIAKADPNYAGASFLLGKIYYYMGDLNKGRESVDNALRIDPGNNEFREFRNQMAALNSKMTEASRVFNNSNYPEARKLYLEVIKENKNIADAHFFLGMVYIRMDSLEKASKYFNNAIKMRPEEENYAKNFDAAEKQLLADGNMLLRRRDYSGAIKKFQGAIKLKNDDYMAFYLCAYAQFSNKENSEAIQSINKSIELNTENTKAVLLQGKIYEKLNNMEAALDSYKNATVLDPEYIDAWNNIGLLYYTRQDYQNAIPAFDKVTELVPDYAKAWANLGAIYIELEKYQEAVNNLKKAVEYDVTSETSWLRLATAYNHTGKCVDAKQAAEKALQIKMNWAAAQFELGVAERCLGNKTAAKQAFQLAMRDPRWKKSAEFELKTCE
jgi:tetratricopeptide (TPR) repeat protein